MMNVLMQAVGADGILLTWISDGYDFDALGFPGPAPAAHVAVSMKQPDPEPTGGGGGSGGVPTTRTLTAGAGLTGGGDLSANRTFAVGANADGTITVNADDIQVGTLVAGNYANNTIGLPKLANASAQFKIVARKSAGAGAWEECTAAELGISGGGGGGTPAGGVGSLQYKADASNFGGANWTIGSAGNGLVGPAGTFVSVGTTPATAGQYRSSGGNVIVLAARGAGAYNIALVTIDNDQVIIGDAANATGTDLNAKAGGGHAWYAGGAQLGFISAAGLTLWVPLLGVTATEIGNDSSTVAGANVAAALDSLKASIIPGTRQVIAGAGLTGGGDLSADRTLNVAAADATITVNPDSIAVGTLTNANYPVNTLALSKLVNASAQFKILGRKTAGAGAWEECTAAELGISGGGGGVPTTTTLTAGAGLTGGGDLSTNRTFDIVAADTTITVNADSIQVGTLVAANYANNTIALGRLANATAQFRLVARKTAGAGAWEECTAAEAGVVPTARTLTAGTNLTGGGDLSADRTIALAAALTGITTINGARVLAPTQGANLGDADATINISGGANYYLPPGTIGATRNYTLGNTGAEDKGIMSIGVGSQGSGVVFKNNAGTTLVTLPPGNSRILDFQYDSASSNYVYRGWKPMQ